jgi:hypothetical protein
MTGATMRSRWQRWSGYVLSDDGRLQDAVRYVLAYQWDPLGTVARGGFDDEYDSYSLGITRLIQAGASIENIASYLLWLEEDRMGVTPHHLQALKVARALKARSTAMRM